MTKDEIHEEARKAWYAAGCRGIVDMGTGTGKSKIALNIIKEFYEKNKKLKVFLGVPTQGLRDKNWPEEAKKWKMTRIYNRCVEGICYISMSKQRARDYDLIILDEGHRMTERASEFFESEEDRLVPVLIITATAPSKDGNDTDRRKAQILEEMNLKTVYKYTLDEAVSHENVADYVIYLVPVELDDKHKYIDSGSKAKPFKTTEKRFYSFLEKRILQTKLKIREEEQPYMRDGELVESDPSPARFVAKRLMGQRMRLLYSLRSKTVVAKKIIDRFVKNQRILVFCGSIEQSNDLVGKENTFNSKTDDRAFEAFKKMKIRILGVVNAVNEGHTIELLDIAVIVQINSNERDLKQRIGRVIRFREGHVARIFLLYVKGTQDEKWMRSALESFDKSKIFELSPSKI